eukprot:sb/3467064/
MIPLLILQLTSLITLAKEYPDLTTDAIAPPYARISAGDGSLNFRCARQRSRGFTLYRDSGDGSPVKITKDIDYSVGFYYSYHSVFSTQEEVERDLAGYHGNKEELLLNWGGSVDNMFFVANVTVPKGYPGEVYTCDFHYNETSNNVSITVLGSQAIIPNSIIGVRIYPFALRCVSQGTTPVSLKVTAPAEGLEFESRNFTFTNRHDITERVISVGGVTGVGQVTLSCEQLGESVVGPVLQDPHIGPPFSDILGGKDFGWALNRGQIPLISYIGENLSGVLVTKSVWPLNRGQIHVILGTKSGLALNRGQIP